MIGDNEVRELLEKSDEPQVSSMSKDPDKYWTRFGFKCGAAYQTWTEELVVYLSKNHLSFEKQTHPKNELQAELRLIGFDQKAAEIHN